VKLYAEYKPKGLEILAFPCNQFGKQEPGSATEIRAFADKYGATFPLFDKVEVNGTNAHPVFKYLKSQCPGMLGTVGIKWNFTKFLVDRNGKGVKRYGPPTKPSEITGDINALL
jgi:glutathione peroxidase